MASVRERLLSKAVINWETGCWEWTGIRDRYGYGRLKVAGRQELSHRLSYGLFEGPIPTGLQLDHLCRVRNCINPAHLEPVTNRENQMRSPINFTAINARKTHCTHGHEFSAENTRIDKRGWRQCRRCWADMAKRYYQRKKSRTS